MSHALTINEKGEAEMFSGQNITPWHKLGQKVPGLLTAKEALKAARLNWKVIQKPIFVDGEVIPDYKANVRSDNGLTLAVVGNRYEVIDNDEGMDFMDFIVGSGQAVYDTAGSLHGGKKVWIMAKLKGSLFLNNRMGDTMDRNVLLATSHDGSTGLTMQIVSTRVVCQNTLSVALDGATNQIKIRHTKSYDSKREAAIKALGLCNAYFDNLQAVMNELDKQAMNQAQMIDFAKVLLPDSKSENQTRSENIRQEIVTLFTRGKGNLGKSRFDALNAVTEFADHTRATRVKADGNADENRFASAMFGSGATLKAKAFSLLTS